jgi:hypothetical protein
METSFVRKLTTKGIKIYQYRWKFLRLGGFESHRFRYLKSSVNDECLPFFRLNR